MFSRLFTGRQSKPAPTYRPSRCGYSMLIAWNWKNSWVNKYRPTVSYRIPGRRRKYHSPTCERGNTGRTSSVRQDLVRSWDAVCGRNETALSMLGLTRAALTSVAALNFPKPLTQCPSGTRMLVVAMSILQSLRFTLIQWYDSPQTDGSHEAGRYKNSLHRTHWYFLHEIERSLDV
jgi:hypothetical protein